MQVRVGPVSAGSVTAWVAYARAVLSAAAEGRADAPPVDAAAAEQLALYLQEWDALAATADPVVWTGEADPEQLEYLAHSFFRIAAALAEQAEARGYPVAPAEGEEFYQALVLGIITALEHESRSTAELSDQLRSTWPGLKEP